MDIKTIGVVGAGQMGNGIVKWPPNPDFRGDDDIADSSSKKDLAPFLIIWPKWWRRERFLPRRRKKLWEGSKDRSGEGSGGDRFRGGGSHGE